MSAEIKVKDVVRNIEVKARDIQHNGLKNVITDPRVGSETLPRDNLEVFIEVSARFKAIETSDSDLLNVKDRMQNTAHAKGFLREVEVDTSDNGSINNKQLDHKYENPRQCAEVESWSMPLEDESNLEATKTFQKSSDGQEVAQIKEQLNAVHQLVVDLMQDLPDADKQEVAKHIRLLSDDIQFKVDDVPHFTPEDRKRRMNEVEDVLSGKRKLPPYKNKQHGGEYDSPIEYVEQHLGRYLKSFNDIETLLPQHLVRKHMKSLYGTVGGYISVHKNSQARKYPEFNSIGQIFPSIN